MDTRAITEAEDGAIETRVLESINLGRGISAALEGLEKWRGNRRRPIDRRASASASSFNQLQGIGIWNWKPQRAIFVVLWRERGGGGAWTWGTSGGACNASRPAETRSAPNLPARLRTSWRLRVVRLPDRQGERFEVKRRRVGHQKRIALVTVYRENAVVMVAFELSEWCRNGDLGKAFSTDRIILSHRLIVVLVFPLSFLVLVWLCDHVAPLSCQGLLLLCYLFIFSYYCYYIFLLIRR